MPISENVSELYKILIPDPIIPMIVSALQTDICEYLNQTLQIARSQFTNYCNSCKILVRWKAF